METNPLKFHFPSEIKLKKNALQEAWLEIRWQLQSGKIPNLMRDPGFPFALGAFYHEVKDRFRIRENLAASNAPEEMLPYVVRYRFRPAEDQWPALQLGPGIATVNFTDSYSWERFLEFALYLREKLLDAYEPEIESQIITLRYRNAAPFDYISNNSLDFISQNLNISITLPPHVPGNASSKPWPVGTRMTFSFDLSEPKSVGRLILGTGTRKHRDVETNEEISDQMLIWELEVSSTDNDAPDLYDEEEFTQWLNSAHTVIHEWFFSLIDGALFETFKSEEE
jgi:uncharacterized protein (TIGR04255 family)